MMLEEANKRLKKRQITEDELWALNSLYIIIDLEKDEFCKMVDMVGVDRLLIKSSYYDHVLQGQDELVKREKYLLAKQRLQELEYEREQLIKDTDNYKAQYSI